eukprot:7019087-Pyramimonas_sp.AAC.1
MDVAHGAMHFPMQPQKKLGAYSEGVRKAMHWWRHVLQELPQRTLPCYFAGAKRRAGSGSPGLRGHGRRRIQMDWVVQLHESDAEAELGSFPGTFPTSNLWRHQRHSGTG